MEELHKIAKTCYDTAPEEVKRLARELFQTMDDDDSGSVSLHEFLAFMRQQGYTQMKNRGFFMELDMDGSGSLEFNEVRTLYYILRSGRPICDGCGELIKAIYFTCINCFENCAATFNLCPDCFRLGNYTHEHNHFLDNFVLLEYKRKAALKRGASISETSHASTTAPSNGTSASASLAIVPFTPQHEQGRKRRAALLAFETALRVASIASNSISACTIM